MTGAEAIKTATKKTAEIQEGIYRPDYSIERNNKTRKSSETN
jgi:hypothetical protein